MTWTGVTVTALLTVGCASAQNADTKATCESAISRLLELCTNHPACRQNLTEVNKAEELEGCKRNDGNNESKLECFTNLKRIEDVGACRKLKPKEEMTHEAIDRLDMIYRASAHYYTAPRVAAGTGLKIECQFPVNQPMTPDVRNTACCGGTKDRDNDNRCDVDTSQWTSPTWSALNFQMNDQHYYGYTYESSGTDANARFTVSAYGDLDCDGVLSTFQRFGFADSSSNGECALGKSTFYKNKELE